MSYIKAWQSLPDFSVSLFIVRFLGSKKDELLGIASNRIMRMDLNSGDHIKTWMYNTVKVCVNLSKFSIALEDGIFNFFLFFKGMAHQLGNKTYDDRIRRRKNSICLSISRL